MIGINLEYYFDNKNPKNGHCFVVKNNDSQIGMAIFKEANSMNIYLKYSVTQNVRKLNFDKNDMVTIELLKIVPNFQGKGLGKKLLNEVIAKSKELKYKSLFVRAEPFSDSRMDLEELIVWYSQFGFYRLKRISRTEQLMQMDL
jgi:N-acetylglutamate synthase-like GNAT family acetyltransferase